MVYPSIKFERNPFIHSEDIVRTRFQTDGWMDRQPQNIILPVPKGGRGIKITKKVLNGRNWISVIPDFATEFWFFLELDMVNNKLFVTTKAQNTLMWILFLCLCLRSQRDYVFRLALIQSVYERNNFGIKNYICRKSIISENTSDPKDAGEG